MEVRRRGCLMLGICVFVVIGLFLVPTCWQMGMLRGAGKQEWDLVLEDEAGVPLDGVRVSVVTSKFSGLRWDALESTEVHYDFDKEGRISAGDGFELYVSKEGYYKRNIGFSWGEKLKLARQMAALEIPSTKPGVTKLRIVLEKVGRVTQLEERGATLAFNKDYSGQTLFIELLKGQAGTNRKDIQDLRDKALFPPHALFVTCPVSEDGFIHIIKLPYIVDGMKVVYEFPEKVVLCATDPGDGLVKFIVPGQEARPYQHAVRRAPLDGYVDSIEFTAKELIDENKAEGQPHCALYFRFGGRYGRGSVWVDSFNENSVKVKVGMELQPDGSTNLETGE